MQDLIAGRIDFDCNIITSALPQINGKLVKAHRDAVARARRRAAGPADRA